MGELAIVLAILAVMWQLEFSRDPKSVVSAIFCCVLFSAALIVGIMGAASL